MIVTELIRDHLWSAPRRTPAEAEAFEDRAHTRAVLVVRLYYALGLLWMSESIGTWRGLLDATTLDPQWPAEWIDLVGTRRGTTLILAAYAGFTVAAAVLPRLLVLRVGYSAALLCYLSLSNGLGKIGHGMHSWFWLSVILVLLPAARSAWRPGGDAARRRAFLQVVMLGQLVILFFYTLTGLWKLLYATRALAGPGVSAFELDGFSYLVGANLLSTNRATVLGDVLVDHPVVGWLLFNGTMYLETASILIVLRPRLHRLWGFGLLMFHLGTMAAMGILFPGNVVLLGLLLLCSPFAPDDVDVRATLLDLPGVRLVARLLARRRAPADPDVDAPPDARPERVVDAAPA